MYHNEYILKAAEDGRNIFMTIIMQNVFTR